MEYKYFTSIPNEGEICRINNLPNFARIREQDEIMQKIMDTDDKEEKKALLDRLQPYLNRR